MERALHEVEERYLDHHRAMGHSEQTITHYKDSFRLLHKWIEATSRSLRSAAIDQAEAPATTVHPRNDRLMMCGKSIACFAYQEPRMPGYSLHGGRACKGETRRPKPTV